MTTNKDLTILPDNLPIPIDDGLCSHLIGLKLPQLQLKNTHNQNVDVASLSSTVVVYIFPMIGRPDGSPLIGWNDIAGARGCTPQSCAFRDIYDEFNAKNIRLIGLSTQSVDDLNEAKSRLHLPFELLSDENLSFAQALNLPLFSYNNKTLVKRLTLVVKNGVIAHVFYPVFPPNQNAQDVLDWLDKN